MENGDRENISFIKARLLSARGTGIHRELLEYYKKDCRKGVVSAVRREIKYLQKQGELLEKFGRMKDFEKKLLPPGCRLYAGIDEAGRGPLAGPVVAAAVILPDSLVIRGLDDSKKLSAGKRDELYGLIAKNAVAWSVGEANHEEIDRLNILNATYLAMERAAAGLESDYGHVLVDGNMPRLRNLRSGFSPVVKGDSKCACIAAASVVAKVHRDRIMEKYDIIYPGYGFGKNKGYGTGEHIAAIGTNGLTPVHRRSFVQNFSIGI